MLNLQTGQQWRTRDGDTVTIRERIEGTPLYWSCSNGFVVDENGNADSTMQTPHDLSFLIDGDSLFADIVEQDNKMPSMAEAKGCAQENCPGADGFSTGYGLAGGGMGAYAYCDHCGLVRGKDQDPTGDVL